VVLDTACLCYWANAPHQAEGGFTTGQDFQSMTLLVSSICVSSTPLFSTLDLQYPHWPEPVSPYLGF
jgi:hypothetical protein